MRATTGRATLLSICVIAGALVGVGTGSGIATAATTFSAATDLGTLGGATSFAEAVDGSVVVGWSDTTDNLAQHAFVYDTAAPSPQMLDLGTLGGTNSAATAVDGTIVVGWSDTTDDVARHAFAYNLGDASPHMIDLNTIENATSSASGVSGNLVVGGWRTGSHGQSFSWYYDLGAASPEMVDMGSMAPNGGFHVTELGAVENGVIVGASYAGPGQSQHAFAYDVTDPAPHYEDLGTFGGTSSFAVALSGSIVVGQATDGDNNYHPFAYDRAASSPQLIDLGTFGGFFGSARDVDGSIVVGESQFANGQAHAFAYDLAAVSPQIIDLGTLSGDAISYAEAVSGGIVVGYSADADFTVTRAIAYDLDAASPQMVNLGTLGGATSFTKHIDPSGLIVGGGLTASGENHAAVWHAIPATTSNHVNETVGAGGTVSTDPSNSGATPEAPLQTAITSPNAGTIDIAQGATTQPTPTGYGLLGFEAVVTAPDATVADPLRFTFNLDASLLAAAGTDAANVVVFRDGVPIGACTNPAVVVAAPDPCIVSRVTLPSGDAQLAVYSSHASHWNFGKQLTTPAVVKITTTSVPDGRVGVAYSKSLTATGGAPPLTWSIASGALPSGLTLNASSGVISGTPTAAGNSSFGVRATDTSPTPRSATKTFAISIAATANPSAAKVGVPYWSKVSAFNGTAPYHWSVISGSLPGGLTLNGNTGAISGTPTAEGKFSFSVQVVDSKPKKPNKVVTKLTIAVAPVAIVLAPSTLPPATRNVKYSATIAASGGAPAYRYSVTSGALPRGITLGSTGALTGKPTAKGTFKFTVTATDTYGFTGARQFSVVVN